MIVRTRKRKNFDCRIHRATYRKRFHRISTQFSYNDTANKTKATAQVYGSGFVVCSNSWWLFSLAFIRRWSHSFVSVRMCLFLLFFILSFPYCWCRWYCCLLPQYIFLPSDMQLTFEHNFEFCCCWLFSFGCCCCCLCQCNKIAVLCFIRSLIISGKRNLIWRL